MRRGIGRLVAGAAVAMLLTGPAAASGEDRFPRLSVTEAEKLVGAQRAGSNAIFVQLVPPAVKRYQWTVVAYKASPKADTLLTIHFARSRARRTQLQSSQFSWTLPPRALKTAGDLRPASLDTGDGMGNNGRIRMSLTSSEEYGRFPAEDGCTGAVSVRVGRLGGRFRFNARDEHFGRISMRGARAFLYRGHDYRCRDEVSPPPPCPPNLSFGAADVEGTLALAAFKTPEGKVDQAVVVQRDLDTGTSLHRISVSLAVPDAFEASDDLSSATVDGDAGTPWLSGDLDYVAPPAGEAVDEECGPYRESSGLATGNYTAHFDSIGDVTPAATGIPATLRREL